MKVLQDKISSLNFAQLNWVPSDNAWQPTTTRKIYALNPKVFSKSAQELLSNKLTPIQPNLSERFEVQLMRHRWSNKNIAILGLDLKPLLCLYHKQKSRISRKASQCCSSLQPKRWLLGSYMAAGRRPNPICTVYLLNMSWPSRKFNYI